MKATTFLSPVRTVFCRDLAQVLVTVLLAAGRALAGGREELTGRLEMMTPSAVTPSPVTASLSAA